MACRYVNAHNRLISMVRMFPVAGAQGEYVTISSSRDRTLKLWMIDNLSKFGTVNVVLKQTLSHVTKSFWSLDFSWPYVVGGCANKRVMVWKSKSMTNISCGDRRQFFGAVDFELYAEFLHDRQDSLRAIAIIDKDTNFALSGDLLGHLNVWNMADKCHQYTVRDENTKSFFNTWNSVSAIVQAKGLAFVAYSKQYFKIFSTHNVKKELVPIRNISIENEVVINKANYLCQPPPTIRSIEICHTGSELYACTHSGMFVISVWAN